MISRIFLNAFIYSVLGWRWLVAKQYSIKLTLSILIPALIGGIAGYFVAHNLVPMMLPFFHQ